jgi:hypothetical protein
VLLNGAPRGWRPVGAHARRSRAQALAHHAEEAQRWVLQPRRTDLGTALTPALNSDSAPEEPAMTKKVYIRSFGCQMNEYDSDKMSDVMRVAEGYEPTTDPEEADLILFNTCSVREKAQEKVFSDLGRVKHLKAKGVLIGVGGCVASQEGAAIIERAPYVDVVFGPQTLHRLPQLLAQRQALGRPQVDISFPEIEKFDHLPPARVEGASAFVSIMEGCSKYCSYCVVPYTRGEEVSRPFDDVLTEVAGLADQGVKEVTLLGQNVNAYRGRWATRPRSPTSPCCWNTWPRSPAWSASATPPATPTSSASADRCLWPTPSWSTTCTCRCSTAATAS